MKHNQKKILQLGMRKPLVAFRRQPTFRLRAKVVEYLSPVNKESFPEFPVQK
ncbi:MAG: hypothetical protein LBK58_03745 [Prevotellaceae bacterium]|jgi:hypothetical protein|nr:hypothetical protein [Prevotellaceae bacterium]